MHSRNAQLSGLVLIAAAGLFVGGCTGNFDMGQHPRPGDITVSSANYVSMPPTQTLVSPDDFSLNPKLIALKPLAQPKFFLYTPGEVDQSDLSFDEVLHLLTPALAAKGYIEASSAIRSGRDPAKRVDLVLRVNCGERYWRDPTVRTNNLTWDDGLVPLQTGHLADMTGESVVWDEHAGGDDAELAAIDDAIGSLSSSGSGMGGGGRGGGGLGMSRGGSYPKSPGGGLSQELTRMPTQDFFLVVVEGYDLKDLLQKKGKSVRLWETFIAVPKKGQETFSQVLPAMLKLGTPYFGESVKGLAVFNDDRAKVEIGTPYVVPDTGPPSPPPPAPAAPGP